MRWTNTGTVAHNVTSGYSHTPDGFVDSGPMAPGAAFEKIFTFHGEFPFYDKYNAAADVSVVYVDYGVFISPGSFVFSVEQGFDLAFHFNASRGCGDPFTPFPLPYCSIPPQCSIVFDGVEIAKGNCPDVFSSLNFKVVDTSGGVAHMLTIPPHTLSPGLHSLSIKAVYPEGGEYSDEAWYRVLGPRIPNPNPNTAGKGN